MVPWYSEKQARWYTRAPIFIELTHTPNFFHLVSGPWILDSKPYSTYLSAQPYFYFPHGVWPSLLSLCNSRLKALTLSILVTLLNISLRWSFQNLILLNTLGTWWRLSSGSPWLAHLENGCRLTMADGLVCLSRSRLISLSIDSRMASLQARWQISVRSAPEKPLVILARNSKSTS